MSAKPKEYTLQSSFNAGEFSSKLLGQVLLKKYRDACQSMQNWLVYPHGPAHTRPGFYYVGELKKSSLKGRLIPFIYSRVQVYMMVWEKGVVRFVAGNSFVIDPNTSLPLEVATPYLEADLPFISVAQSFDIMYLVRRNYPIRKLQRHSETSWDIPVVSFDDGPYRDINIDGTLHLQPSAKTGTGITLTATKVSVPEDIGTSGGTEDVPQPGFTSTTPYVGFAFTPSEPCVLDSFTLYVANLPATAISVAASLYADSGGSPTGSAIATVAGQFITAGTGGGHWETPNGENGQPVWVPDVVQTGTAYSWNFSPAPSLSASTRYWIIAHAASTDNTMTLKTAIHDNAYLSGAGTSVGALTDSLVQSWKVDIGITPSDPSISVFDPNHVGATWRLKHPGSESSKTFTAKDQTSDPILLRGKFTVDASPITPTSSGGAYWDGQIILQSSTDKQNWFDVANFFYSTTQDFIETKDNVWYRLYCKRVTAGTNTVAISQAEQWGTIRITQYVSQSQVIGDVLFPFGDTTPTSFWREGAWSQYRGYPEAVLFHDNRLYFGRDGTIWGSWVGDFENFNPDGDTDAAAVTFLPSQLNNSIVWMESVKGLMLGSIGEEGRITGSNEKPITQTAIKCEIQTTEGSAQYPQPLRIGQAALFVQTDRRKVREFVFDIATDSFKAPDLTVRAEHITVGGIFDSCYQKNPHKIAWFVRGDGVLLGMTYYRDEDVVAWHRIITDGQVESCAVKPSSLGVTAGYDELWVIVKRMVNGQAKRYIEIMANHEPTAEGTRQASDFMCLDCAKAYTTQGLTTLTGLDHLEGRAITVVLDGVPISGLTVSSGSVALPRAIVTNAYAGLPYECVLGTNPFDTVGRDGATIGRQTMSFKLFLRLFETVGGEIGPDLDHMRPIEYRRPADLMGQQVPLFSGVMELVYNGNKPDPSIWIRQTDPLPMTVLAAGLLQEVND